MILGDMNVHHARWLRLSLRNSVEGEMLRSFCDYAELRQEVKQPTRGEYLLDLLLTNSDALKCRVLPMVVDHNALWFTLPLPAPRSSTLTRVVWQYKSAGWEGMKQALTQQNWSWLSSGDVHMAVRQPTAIVLS